MRRSVVRETFVAGKETTSFQRGDPSPSIFANEYGPAEQHAISVKQNEQSCSLSAGQNTPLIILEGSNGNSRIRRRWRSAVIKSARGDVGKAEGQQVHGADLNGARALTEESNGGATP